MTLNGCLSCSVQGNHLKLYVLILSRERSCIFSSVCFCFSCAFHLKMPSFSTCCMSCKSESLQCSCLENTTCPKCYKCEGPSCPACACCCYGPFFHKFKKVNFCCGCRKACYSSCCQ